MILKAKSKGLFSSWYFYAPDRLLFDCGEGVSLELSYNIFAIEKIVLTHGHIDHISGLMNLINLRHSTKGDTKKDLTIYYPAGDKTIEGYRQAITDITKPFLGYQLEWVAIDGGTEIPLKKGRILKAFKVNHGSQNPLGYNIIERRKKLHPDYAGLPGQEIAKIPDDKKYMYYDAIILSYSGDSMADNPDNYKNSELLIHDCTFLAPEDRDHPKHATAQEVMDLAKEAGVKQVVLTHISPRYQNRKTIYKFMQEIDSHGIPFKWVPHDSVFVM